jgi:hypothetical protein
VVLLWRGWRPIFSTAVIANVACTVGQASAKSMSCLVIYKGVWEFPPQSRLGLIERGFQSWKHC